jgi:hypothetical protein
MISIEKFYFLKEIGKLTNEAFLEKKNELLNNYKNNNNMNVIEKKKILKDIIDNNENLKNIRNLRIKNIISKGFFKKLIKRY